MITRKYILSVLGMCINVCFFISSQASSGNYLLFQSNSNAAAQRSYTISSTQNVTFDKDHCLTMWYFDDGEDPFSVQVYMILPKYDVLANGFSSAIENRRHWNVLKADIQFNPGYKANCKLF